MSSKLNINFGQILGSSTSVSMRRDSSPSSFGDFSDSGKLKFGIKAKKQKEQEIEQNEIN
jgi:hypothetical protein